MIASVIGKILALEAAVRPRVQLLSRMAQFELADQVEATESWNVKITLSTVAREGLQHIKDRISSWNGQLIEHLSNATPLKAILGESSHVGSRQWWGDKPDAIIAGDASSYNENFQHPRERHREATENSSLCCTPSNTENHISGLCRWRKEQFCGLRIHQIWSLF